MMPHCYDSQLLWCRLVHPTAAAIGVTVSRQRSRERIATAIRNQWRTPHEWNYVAAFPPRTATVSPPPSPLREPQRPFAIQMLRVFGELTTRAEPAPSTLRSPTMPQWRCAIVPLRALAPHTLVAATIGTALEPILESASRRTCCSSQWSSRCCCLGFLATSAIVEVPLVAVTAPTKHVVLQ